LHAGRQDSFDASWDQLSQTEAAALAISQSCLHLGCKFTHQARLLRNAKPTLHATKPAMQHTLRGRLNACCSQFHIMAVVCLIRTMLPALRHGCLIRTMLPALHQVCHIKTMLLHRLAVLYYSILPKPGHLISPHRSPLLTRLLPQNLCYAKPVPFVSFPYLNFTPDLFALQTWVLSISNYLKLS